MHRSIIERTFDSLALGLEAHRTLETIGIRPWTSLDLKLQSGLYGLTGLQTCRTGLQHSIDPLSACASTHSR